MLYSVRSLFVLFLMILQPPFRRLLPTSVECAVHEFAYKGSDFSEHAVFLRTCQAAGSPHTSSHMSGHHPATVRRAGRKSGIRFESSEALAEQPAVARSAVELHRC